ncbi:MAG: hydrogenase maturation nickel metallochaperone HypA [Desulfobacteraceae bacterium]|nr:hydrogenase maturation nickel metallochaperone HypA [Desulfobacteraceae bacterium]
MHEMGIAMEIVRIAIESIPAEIDSCRVERVNLRIGKLSAVVPDSLKFCFEVAAKDTPVEGAALAIEEIPVLAMCKACGHEWTITGPVFTCSQCDSGKIEVISGRELDIKSIEINEED